MPHYNNPALGIAATLFAVLLFSLMDAIVKWLGAAYPLQQIMFFRCVVALVPVTIIVYRAGGAKVLHTQRPGLHALRAVLGTGAMACAFYGFTTMKLADAAAIFYAAPLLAVAFSVPILGERVGVRRWSAVVLGLTGALLVVRPGGDMFSHGGGVMLIGAGLVGVTTNIVRALNRNDHPICTTFYFTVAGVAVSSAAVLIFGWHTPTWVDAVLLCAVGVLGGLAQYFHALGFRCAEVSLLAPFKYLSIIFGGGIGYLVWREVPDGFTLLGIGVILASGLYTIRREARILRRKTQSAEELRPI